MGIPIGFNGNSFGFNGNSFGFNWNFFVMIQHNYADFSLSANRNHYHVCHHWIGFSSIYIIQMLNSETLSTLCWNLLSCC
jgi:hypothetical protein